MRKVLILSGRETEIVAGRSPADVYLRRAPGRNLGRIGAESSIDGSCTEQSRPPVPFKTEYMPWTRGWVVNIVTGGPPTDHQHRASTYELAQTLRKRQSDLSNHLNIVF